MKKVELSDEQRRAVEVFAGLLQSHDVVRLDLTLAPERGAMLFCADAYVTTVDTPRGRRQGGIGSGWGKVTLAQALTTALESVEAGRATALTPPPKGRGR